MECVCTLGKVLLVEMNVPYSSTVLDIFVYYVYIIDNYIICIIIIRNLFKYT